MKKKRLRHIYLTKRMNLSVEKKLKLENKIFSLFQTISLDFFIHSFLSYKAIQEKNEINLTTIEGYIESKFLNTKKCYPVMSSSTNGLQIIGVNEDTVFAKNHWNIEEPTNGIPIDKKYLDIILTPMLIFDENGFRVGYGKGMYDTLFGRCKKEVLKIGFCFFQPIQKIEDIQPHDVSLDIVVTPEKIFRFKV